MDDLCTVWSARDFLKVTELDHIQEFNARSCSPWDCWAQNIYDDVACSFFLSLSLSLLILLFFLVRDAYIGLDYLRNWRMCGKEGF